VTGEAQAAESPDELLLEVRNLSVTFDAGRRDLRAVHDVSLTLRRGEVLAVVGESGCGKSVTASTIIGLTRGPRTRIEGQILYRGRELANAPEQELRKVRGKEIAMVFQDALAALNPVHRVGDQVAEMVRLHDDVRAAEADRRAVRMLEEVGVADARVAARRYPHEFSGGMRQRALTAIALVNNPPVLIADEPTTALDVTIQAQVLDLIDRLRRDHGTAVILITHDLGVVAQFADRVAVMYAGTIVEQGTCAELFGDPQHPYTWGLLGCVPRVDRPRQHELESIEGSPPSITDRIDGCRFRPRCRYAHDRCLEEPSLTSRRAPGHLDACFLEPERKEALRPADVVASEPVP
jgi:peptide/nickel transport system ATP-binding protein/oligopeptide transport system ATP-binding protein